MSSRLPDRPAPEPTPAAQANLADKDAATPTGKDKKPQIPSPKLLFEIRDLRHSGSTRFQSVISAGPEIEEAISTVIAILYGSSAELTQYPPVRSITFILKSMDGVAYTTSKELDEDHKEIHLSLEYTDAQSDERLRQEILGVINHEMVHVWQWNALGTCPGGLIEGIADYVRLKAGFAPQHWKREPGHTWDAGYERTGFFLEWLEDQHGEGKIIQLNGLLRREEYKEEKLWKRVFGQTVDDLFEEYKTAYEREEMQKTLAA